MKCAILMAGYLRVFKQNLPLLKKKFFNKIENYDLYVHITLDEYENDKYYNLSNKKDLDALIISLNPTKVFYDNDRIFSKNPKTNGIKNLWHKFYLLNSFITNSRINYDLVFKIRPDMVFHENFQLPKFVTYDNETIFLPKKTLIDKKKLKNVTDPYICDIFAFGSQPALTKYFKIYENLDHLIETYGVSSETLLFYHLYNENIKYSLIDIDFSVILSECNVIAIAGDSGVGKSKLAEKLKLVFNNSFILEGDRYHKWDREDGNWKHVTHLNPRSNFIGKMRSDIFDLKIGNSIYQVDYDHKIGKFTDKQKIDPKKNIIVCGLHSLHCSINYLYDLKIYIDSDDDIKTNWKISRDVKERSKSRNQTLSEIERRKEDYKKHIRVQRNKSDIVIRYSKNEKDILLLSLFIHKKYDIRALAEKLKRVKLTFDLVELSSQNFNEIIFLRYKFLKLFRETINYEYSKDFNDYIIFIILHLY